MRERRLLLVLLVILLIVAAVGGAKATRSYNRTAELKQRVTRLHGDIAREVNKINSLRALRAEMEVERAAIGHAERDLAAANAEIERLEAELGR